MSDIFDKLNTGKTSVEGGFEITEVKNDEGKVIGKLKNKLPAHHPFKDIEGQEFTDSEALSMLDFLDTLRTNFDPSLWSDEEIAEQWADEVDNDEMKEKDSYLAVVVFVTCHIPIADIGIILNADVDERAKEIAKSRISKDKVNSETIEAEENTDVK